MYCTPSELLDRHPHLAQFWNAREIGYLLMLGLVRGRKLARTCHVLADDVLKIAEHRK